MINHSLYYLLIFLFSFSIINCKTKNKKQKEERYFPRKYTPLADRIRPSDVSRELFCDVCQAIFTEALINLRNLNKESDVAFYLNNKRICGQENFNGYHFSTPEMEIGCEVFFSEYYDEVQELLVERNPNKDTNETLVRKFCYKTIKACNGVDLTRFKPIKAEIVNGELYDLEPVEQVYKVTPKFIDDDFENYTSIMENETNNNITEL